MGRTRGFDERAVLTTVRERFWEHGYEGTSTYDLAAATKLGKGSIAHAFGTKHDLYLRVFGDYCDEIVAGAEQALHDPAVTSPRRRLEAYVFWLTELFSGDMPRQGCFLSRATADLAGVDEAVAALSRSTFARLAGGFSSTIRAAQEIGEIAPGLDADTLGYVVLSAIRGIDCVGRAGMDADLLRDVARTAMSLLPRPPAT